jgi:hypothetical protein
MALREFACVLWNQSRSIPAVATTSKIPATTSHPNLRRAATSADAGADAGADAAAAAGADADADADADAGAGTVAGD